MRWCEWRAAALAALAALTGCSSQPAAHANGRTEAGAEEVDVSAHALVDAGAGDGSVVDADASGVGAPATASFDEVAAVLYVEPSKCPQREIDCLFAARYTGDATAAATAKSMLDRWNIVAGVEHAYTMDGGYRGMIRIEPAVPTGVDKKQLDWIVAAFDDLERFEGELKAPAANAFGAARYRWRPLTFRFFRSVGKRTPSAYAQGWTIAWNLNGSLHTSGDAVRETLTHEIFHLNDYAHHMPNSELPWSDSALAGLYDSIVKKCGTAIACLTPYSPGETLVRGGTFYSFQPGNDVREYAAELASRYIREQRATLRKLPGKKPFKCGPSENARAWSAIRAEFFSGIDVTPPCP